MKIIERRKSKIVKIGRLKIGGNNPIAIGGMAKSKTENITSVVREIKGLEGAGCELIRVAVKTKEAAKALKKIKEKINIPLIADIHFDYRLALEAIENGVDKIRINPGNIPKNKHLIEVIKKAKEYKIPIRIGLNSGSLPTLLTKGNFTKNITRYTLKYIRLFENNGFYDIIISLKASDVLLTIRLNEEIAKKVDYPLHLGVTATGINEMAVIKSALGIGTLLQEGIGDTLRVSLTSKSIDEIKVAKEILQVLGLRRFTPEIISCPTCGRCQVDLIKITKSIQKFLEGKPKKDTSWSKLRLAVMGCEVNGPKEAKAADIGVACGKEYAFLFKKGKIGRRIKTKNIKRELLKEINNEMV